MFLTWNSEVDLEVLHRVQVNITAFAPVLLP
jgi:hypothetical protein